MATKLVESPRDRLLAAANELFYQEGVHSVGIDRVLERAGVAKASLYSTFGSKDELVRAYLQGRYAARNARITKRIAQHATPRARILAIFELLGELAADPKFRGCAFVNANAEGPSGKVRSVCEESRGWLRQTFADQAHEAGARDPALLARQLQMLYEGASIAATMEHDPAPALVARDTAATLLDAAITARRPARARGAAPAAE